MENRPTLLFLTDLGNGSEEEDIIISNYLHDHFQVIICHPADCETLEDAVDGIIIRNTWNDENYGKPSSRYYERFRRKKLRVHDDLYTPDPVPGKEYLIQLYRDGFPVIPTFGSLEDVPSHLDDLFIKPRDGFSAIGAKRVPRTELRTADLSNQIIQPYVDFLYEVSFYFIDKKFMHALYAPDPKERWDLVPYNPTSEDMQFAERFTAWNRQKYGIERIDACRTKEGKLLLVEVTDQGGTYLSMPLLPEDLKERFLKELVSSLHRNLDPKNG